MRKMILIIALFAVSCGDKKNVAPEVTLSEKEISANEDVIYSQTIQKQTLLIRDQTIVVTRAIVESKNLEKTSLYLIKTPTQTMSFSVGEEAKSLQEGLAGRYLELLQADQSEEPKVLDLKIDAVLEHFAVVNTLSLDRCRSVTILPKVVDLLSQPRSAVYFAVSVGGYVTPRIALRWDLSEKRFTGIVPTVGFPTKRVDELEGSPLLLTPNVDVRDHDFNLYLDSVFLETFDFNVHCDSRYNLTPGLKYQEKESFSDQFLPKYESRIDQARSEHINDMFPDIESVFGISTSIYYQLSDPLSDDLISYAKSLPNFKKFIQGQ